MHAASCGTRRKALNLRIAAARSRHRGLQRLHEDAVGGRGASTATLARSIATPRQLATSSSANGSSSASVSSIGLARRASIAGRPTRNSKSDPFRVISAQPARRGTRHHVTSAQPARRGTADQRPPARRARHRVISAQPARRARHRVTSAQPARRATRRRRRIDPIESRAAATEIDRRLLRDRVDLRKTRPAHLSAAGPTHEETAGGNRDHPRRPLSPAAGAGRA